MAQQEFGKIEAGVSTRALQVPSVTLPGIHIPCKKPVIHRRPAGRLG